MEKCQVIILIIRICWFGAQEAFLIIIIVEEVCSNCLWSIHQGWWI